MRAIDCGGVSAYLGGDGMTSGREEFGDTGRLEPGFSETKGGPQAGTACTTGSGVSGDGWKTESAHTTTASYSCSMRGYLPDDHEDWGTGETGADQASTGVPELLRGLLWRDLGLGENARGLWRA